MSETFTSGLSGALTNVTTFISEAFDWVGTAVETVVGEPILFISVIAVPLVGLGVGLFKRLVNSN